MRDFIIGVVIFILVSLTISYLSPLNFLESFGFVFFGVLIKTFFTELRKNK